jgi:hypothetical protein
VNRPSGGNKREQFSNEVVYDENFDTINGIYGSGHYANPTYEEIENVQQSDVSSLLKNELV